MAPVSSKEFLDIQAIMECGFTLKRVRDMIKIYSNSFLFSLFLNEKKTFFVEKQSSATS